MSDRFIKFIPSEEADYLQENHPNAFLLLCLIAKRARRISGNPDGLEIGEAHIGDYKKAGIASEKMYRTAKIILSQRGHLLFIETCRNRKKGATGRATVGTKVKLLRSDVWDINFDVKGDIKGDRGATEGRPKGDEQDSKDSKDSKTTAVGIFACLKEDSRLTELQKLDVMKTGAIEERVRKALEYSKLVHPKTTLIQMLVWHCKEPIPPEVPKKKKNLQQELKKAFKVNCVYNQATCFYMGDKIAFQRGMTISESLMNSEEGVKKMLDQFGIKFDYEWKKQ